MAEIENKKEYGIEHPIYVEEKKNIEIPVTVEGMKERLLSVKDSLIAKKEMFEESEKSRRKLVLYRNAAIVTVAGALIFSVVKATLGNKNNSSNNSNIIEQIMDNSYSFDATNPVQRKKIIDKIKKPISDPIEEIYDYDLDVIMCFTNNVEPENFSYKSYQEFEEVVIDTIKKLTSKSAAYAINCGKLGVPLEYPLVLLSLDEMYSFKNDNAFVEVFQDQLNKIIEATHKGEGKIDLYPTFNDFFLLQYKVFIENEPVITKEGPIYYNSINGIAKLMVLIMCYDGRHILIQLYDDDFTNGVIAYEKVDKKTGESELIRYGMLNIHGYLNGIYNNEKPFQSEYFYDQMKYGELVKSKSKY